MPQSYPKPPCSVDGCDDPTKTTGLCGFHYYRKQRFGDPLGGGPKQRQTRSGECSVDGCDKPRQARGLCQTHLREDKLAKADACRLEGCGRPVTWKSEQLCSGHAARKRKFGDPEAGGPMRRPRNSNIGGVCEVDDCHDETHIKGLCAAHYRRLLAYGDPLGEPPPRVYKERGPCGVEGCPDLHSSHGYCYRHSYRFLKYGDPLVNDETRRRRVDRNEVEAFIEQAIEFVGDECLPWPYIRSSDRYPAATIDLGDGPELVSVHRFVLAAVAGPPPDGETWFACHAPVICHDSLCVNPRHLRWDTPQGNVDDKILDGTMTPRWVSPFAGLTRSQVLSLYHDARSSAELAPIFGVDACHIDALRKEQAPDVVA